MSEQEILDVVAASFRPQSVLAIAKKVGGAKRVWSIDNRVREILLRLVANGQVELTKDFKIKKI
jgi:hypothetical protein